VITHSLTALYAASSLSNLNIIALGGIYAPATSSFTGISTLDALSRLSIQTIFISATGVSIENGLTNSTYLEAEIKRSVVQRGNRVVLMADQSKFGHSAVISFCPFEQLYAIVTDCLPSEPYLEAIDRYGIRLICPGHESD
jgi:DeoR family myo-inositol catabolism operon transcriptional repressor